MFNVMHRNDFVTQKVSRHRSFSVWTRAWTRIVVDTLRGNMSVEPKHRKLWDKLYTETSSHEKICMRHAHISQNVAQRDVFHSEYTSQPFAWVKPMISDMISYVKSWIHTRPPMWTFAPGDVLVSQNSAEKRLLVKNCTLSRLTVDTTCSDTSHSTKQWEIMFETAHRHGFVCQNLHTHMSM